MNVRWAPSAIGAGVARRRAGAEMDQQAQQYEAQQQQAQRQIEEQQRQIEALKQQKQNPPQPQSQQEDITQKLLKFAELKKQGIISDEEFPETQDGPIVADVSQIL